MYYGGIDAHQQYLTVAVVDKDSAAVLERRVASDPAALLEVLAPYRPLAVVVETCPFWPWIYDVLSEAGIQVTLAHAKRLRAIASASQKSDEGDALLLARMLNGRLIPRAYARCRPQREALRLVRHRATLVRLRTAAANRIHAQLHQSGLSLPRARLLRLEGQRWLQEVAWARLQMEQRAIVEGQLALIEHLNAQRRPLERRIRARAAKDPDACLLRSVPGFGATRSLLLASEIAPIDRFASAAHLVSYGGLAPVTRSSGGHTRHGSLPQGANRWVRRELISAIPSHLRYAPESWLSQSYARLEARLGWRKARVAAARQLARAIYHMLQRGEPWRGERRVAEPADERGELRLSHAAPAASAAKSAVTAQD